MVGYADSCITGISHSPATWLLGKPTGELKLKLEIELYMCLGKQEIQSIREKLLWMEIQNVVGKEKIKSGTAKKKGVINTNASVTNVHVMVCDPELFVISRRNTRAV